MAKPANIINHIGLVLDASSSMAPHARSLIQVADSQIQHLARRSKELDQETRISVWVFSYANNIQCVVWDKDVLRLPSIAEFYRPNGQTAFVDATLKSIDDLSETPERYGDHSFLLYVLTDGEENNSRNIPSTLLKRITELPNHWTMAALVPNTNAKHEAKRFGFPPGNIEIWDTTSVKGVAEVGERIRAATDAYMDGRTSGLRSTTNLFSTDAATVNAVTIAQAGLAPLARNTYVLIPVPKDTDISTFTKQSGFDYRTGKGYYQLMKREEIQVNKDIMVVEKAPTARVFSGAQARQLIGLPDMTVKVNPDPNGAYDVFVQSTSNNRKLIAGTKFLYRI
jgi:hypothetical protein